MRKQRLGLRLLGLPADRPGPPCECRPRSRFQKQGQPRLRKRGLAATDPRKPERLPIPLFVQKIQRRAVESDDAEAQVPRPRLAKLRKGRHAGPAELLERSRPEPGPGAGDRGLPRNPHRNAGSHKAEPVRQAAEDLAHGDLPEQPHRDHVVDHRLQREVAAPLRSTEGERPRRSRRVRDSRRSEVPREIQPVFVPLQESYHNRNRTKLAQKNP